MNIDSQYIANPFNTSQAMILSQATCQTNPKLGVAYVEGKDVGCWGVDNDGSVWLVVNNRNHHITNDQLTKNARDYSILNQGLPWKTIQSITGSNRQPPVTIYTPPVNTYYYGNGGDYIGRSISY